LTSIPDRYARQQAGANRSGLSDAAAVIASAVRVVFYYLH
jgi:hypothetical protein